MARKTNCIKNGKPQFRITLVIGHDENGKAKRKTFFGKSEKEALAKKEVYLQGVREGLDIQLATQGLGRAMRVWLFEVKKPDADLKATTFTRYHGVYTNHIKGTDLDSMPVAAIKPIHIQRFLNQLAAAGRTQPTVKIVYKVIKMFFAYAVEQGYTVKDPCAKSITVPGGKYTQKRVEIFTDEEIARLKAVLVGPPLRLLVLLALGTGLRQGELLGLRYSDVKDAEVAVHSTLAKATDIMPDGTRNSSFVLWDPKTENSSRRVPIPKDLLSEISSHRARQIEERMKLGIGGEPEFIFTTGAGGFLSGTSVRRLYKRALEEAGIPYKKFHALRHTYATNLVKKGADIDTVMRLLGHSNINVTAIYFHEDEEEKKKAADSLNAWFAK